MENPTLPTNWLAALTSGRLKVISSLMIFYREQIESCTL